MSLSEEESNFLRFYFLNLKIVSRAVRVYFDSVHSPPGLANELANSYGTLKGLRFITKSQLQKLYPSPSCSVRSEDFDSTLLVCLLRNMTPGESTPITGWDYLPHPSDTSKGADLARVKWYRNMLAHHEDGKLSLTDFSQYWADLEGAILRLGGPSLLKESQSAQHIVLDTSFKDILSKIISCEKDVHTLQKSKENNTSLINDLQTKLDYLQKDKIETQNLATKLSDTTESIAKFIQEVEVYRKTIEMNEKTVILLQEQSINKHDQLDKLYAKIDKLEIKYENQDKMFIEHDTHLAKHDGQLVNYSEQMAKHDEQIAEHAKDINVLKKKQQKTDNLSESKRKRLEDDTQALIFEDFKEGTFVKTEAVKAGLILLEQNGFLLITGRAGTGKSRISRHILHMFCSKDSTYKCLKLNKLQEWEDIIDREDKAVILLDDIFGETNCIYNRENDVPILDKVHAYVCSGNIKVMVTIRDTVKRQCPDVFDSHRLFNHEFVDLSSDKYKLNWVTKRTMLEIYMKTVRKSDYRCTEGYVNRNCKTTLGLREISEISNVNPIKGFPLLVYQFVHHDKYFQLGSKFFDMPTEAILGEINEVRRKGDDHKRFMIQYGVMVYTAINENGLDPDDISHVTEVVKIIDAIYDETIKMKRYQISDAVRELKGSYLVKIPNQNFYRYHHQTLQEGVILSFAQLDDTNLNQIIPLLSWTFILKMVKSNAYIEKEGEVVLKIPTQSYKLLAYRLVEIFMAKYIQIRNGVHMFLFPLSNAEIFQQRDCVLLAYLLDALEKTDYKDNLNEHRIGTNSRNNILSNVKKTDVFLSVLLVIIATQESHYEIFQFIMQRLNQIIRADNYNITVDYVKAALVTSLYQFCRKKDAIALKYVKTLLDTVEEAKIPVLLNINIKLPKIKMPNIHSSMHDYHYSDTSCVFLFLCIVKAYQQFNIPLLEFLLSRYENSVFEISVFLKAFYGKYAEGELSSLSHKPLKWMIEKFQDQHILDIGSTLKNACKLQMRDFVKYLASIYRRFDAMFCLKAFLGLEYSSKYRLLSRHNDESMFDKEIFKFLFSKIESTSTDLTSFINEVLQKVDVPNYMFDAFLPFCLNDTDTLILACRYTHFYVAKQIIERRKNVDIQTILSYCFETPSDNWPISLTISYQRISMVDQKLKLVKYIIEKFGCEKFDLKTVCQQVCHCKMFKIITWLVENIDLTLLDVDFIRNSSFQEGSLDMLKCTFNKTELSSFLKAKSIESIVTFCSKAMSTETLEVVSTVLDGIDDSQQLKLKVNKIFDAACKQKNFNLFVVIYQNYNSYVPADMDLLILALENDLFEAAKFVLQTLEATALITDERNVFTLACDKMLVSFCYPLMVPIPNTIYDRPGLVFILNLILKKIQINPLDIKSRLCMLFSLQGGGAYGNICTEDILLLIVFMLQKCVKCLITKDIQLVMNTSLDTKLYVVVNWLLNNVSLSSFAKQTIMNKACEDTSIETIKLLSKHFSSLDMTNAMISTCKINKNVACLDIIWNYSDHSSTDISKILSAIYKEEYVNGDVVTWILQNFPNDQIPINKVLSKCCKQGQIDQVKYICHEIDNKLLNIKDAFCNACQAKCLPYVLFKSYENVVMLVDFLFQRLHDKTSSVSILFNELLDHVSFDIILYFLKRGYCRTINMKSLMNKACRRGHFRLVLWILANIQHTKLDFKSAFYPLVSCRPSTQNLMCIYIMRYYVPDVKMLGIGDSFFENH